MNHFAIVGAGPSGIFAAAELLERDSAARVDLFDKLPTPLGLVRYGVAPDHLKIKSVAQTLSAVLSDDRLQFFGNVELGRSLSLDQLLEGYEGVIVATGAPHSRQLNIPGEQLRGSLSASQIVSWYNGHPDATTVEEIAGARRVAVVGAGNVSLDVARVLLKGGAGLASTDIPTAVLDRLGAVDEVTIVVRRGVSDVKFSLAELLELEKLDDVELVVEPSNIVLDEAATQIYEQKRTVARIVDTFRSWAHAERPATNRRKVLRFKFNQSPIRIIGTDHVEALVLLAADEALSTLEVDTVVRSVGYAGDRLPGVPWDAQTLTIPSQRGLVAPRLCTTGWIKRGPSGVIGTNKACAVESVGELLADLTGREPTDRSSAREGLLDRLRSSSDELVDLDGWQRIDAAESARGASESRVRVKIVDRQELLKIGGIQSTNS